jgi:hypothetical protein
MTCRWILLPTTSTNLTCRIELFKGGEAAIQSMVAHNVHNFLDRYKKEGQAL